MPTSLPWFEMPSPFESEVGKVLLLEPPWASRELLQAQLLDESYAKPFVIDNGEERHLFFNLRLTQSVMRLREPNELAARYTQAMMSFLLFSPRPKRIVLIGLGGGSLLKFCFHRLPAAALTAVEIDPHIIALREAFQMPPDGPRLQILNGDGAEYLVEPGHGMDILLVDAFDKAGFAPNLANRAFFEAARARLSGNGVLVVNLAGDPANYAGLLSEAMHVFDDQVIVFAVPEDCNHILLAFKKRNFEPRWRWLHNHARELRARYALDFPDFVRRIERSTKLGLAYRLRSRQAW
ncbi:MAG: spermidine synthase-like protein [Zoogloeaceae bacterium]|nr:spermidine synthase-like protein [Zoogloeaceae bacterium]